MVRAAVILIAMGWTATSFGWEDRCSQVITVITPDWTSNSGVMRRYTLAKGSWRKVGKPIAVTVGHKGLGWGLGLHAPRRTEPLKREGDHRAPAGVFRLEFGFGARPLRTLRFPYFQIGSDDRWVDDPGSRFYNQWTNLNDPRFPKDWSSAEVLLRKDGIYDHVIVVGHNRQSTVPGRGSAIFMHSWFGPGKSTIGCTAMPKDQVKTLLRWLEPDAHPLLIQLPRDEIASLAIPEVLKATLLNSSP